MSLLFHMLYGCTCPASIPCLTLPIRAASYSSCTHLYAAPQAEQSRVITVMLGSLMPSRSRACIARPWDLSRLRRHPCQRPDLTELLPHLPPRVPCVGTHEQLAVEGAGQHQVGVGWMGRQAADVAVRLAGQGQGFPGFPTVLGALHRPNGGRRRLAMTDKYHVRVICLHGNGTGIGM